eukprot:7070272-Alexandrium_andersonii.AAC.1
MLEAASAMESGILAYQQRAGARLPAATALGSGDFHLARHTVAVIQLLSDATQAMQAHTATASQCIPQLHALKEDYSRDASVLVLQPGHDRRCVEAQLSSLLPPAQRLAEAIYQDIEVNKANHLRHSRDTLLKATLLDPRYRSRG